MASGVGIVETGDDRLGDSPDVRPSAPRLQHRAQERRAPSSATAPPKRSIALNKTPAS
jgi:hypothetical protein